MFVKPAPGRAVRWPDSMRLLNAAGETVPQTPFWLLALHHNDIVEAKPDDEVEAEKGDIAEKPDPEPEKAESAAPDVVPQEGNEA